MFALGSSRAMCIRRWVKEHARRAPGGIFPRGKNPIFPVPEKSLTRVSRAERSNTATQPLPYGGIQGPPVERGQVTRLLKVFSRVTNT